MAGAALQAALVSGRRRPAGGGDARLILEWAHVEAQGGLQPWSSCLQQGPLQKAKRGSYLSLLAGILSLPLRKPAAHSRAS